MSYFFRWKQIGIFVALCSGLLMAEEPNPALVMAPTTIGLILPLSGRFKIYGERSLAAVRLALSLPKRATPATSISIEQGPGFSLIIADSKGNAETAGSVALQLASEYHVAAIIGDLLDETSYSIAQTAEKLGVPNLSLARRVGIAKIGPKTFRIGLSSEKMAKALAEKAVNELKLSKFAVLYPKRASAEELKADFENEIKKRRATVVISLGYDQNQTDFTKDVRKLLGNHSGKMPPFDAIFIPELPKTLSYALPALRAQDILISQNPRQIASYKKALSLTSAKPVQLIGTNAWNDASLAERLGTLVDGALFVDGMDFGAPNPQLARFAEEFEKVTQSKPTLQEAQAFDAAVLLKSMIVPRDGSPNVREQLTERLNRVRNFQGISGFSQFDADGDSLGKMVWFTFDNGKIRRK